MGGGLVAIAGKPPLVPSGSGMGAEPKQQDCDCKPQSIKLSAKEARAHSTRARAGDEDNRLNFFEEEGDAVSFGDPRTLNPLQDRGPCTIVKSVLDSGASDHCTNRVDEKPGSCQGHGRRWGRERRGRVDHGRRWRNAEYRRSEVRIGGQCSRLGRPGTRLIRSTPGLGEGLWALRR